MNKLIVTNAQECIGCHICEIACVTAHNDEQWPVRRQDFRPRIKTLTIAGSENRSTAVTCRHCNNAPCVASCPVNALAFNHDSVTLEQSLCIGCKECVLACPFGVIEMVPASQPVGMLAQKCDFCVSTNRNEPACVSHCPTRAISVVDAPHINFLRTARQSRVASSDFLHPRELPRREQILPKNKRKGADKLAAQERLAHFGEIYSGLDDVKARYESERCIYCAEKANCNWTCPLHNAIPDFIRLVKEGQVIEAAELCNQTSSLPEICGRVCPQERLCEGACTLKPFGGSVSIGNLERYITDTALARGWKPTLSGVTPAKERVAVVGAGPAGLGCADILARAGVSVAVFDRHPEIGGLLTFGIPPFKLDKQLLAQRRELFASMGIRFHLNCEVGENIAFETLLADYDAVFIGAGTYGLMNSGLEHEDSPGVVQALDFLTASTRRVMGLADDPRYPWVDVEGKHVVVLGGGDTAMDCLRTACRRSAASVTCAYRRDEASMPGSRKEVINAREEGVEFLFNVQPRYIVRNRKKRVSAIGLIRTQLGEPGKDGRRRPQPVPGSEFELPADVLIMAFGFQPHAMPWLDKFNVVRDDWGLIKTGENGRLATQTSNSQIFAGGDAVHGADLVVTAMAAGRQAAQDMISWFEARQKSQVTK